MLCTRKIQTFMMEGEKESWQCRDISRKLDGACQLNEMIPKWCLFSKKKLLGHISGNPFITWIVQEGSLWFLLILVRTNMFWDVWGNDKKSLYVKPRRCSRLCVFWQQETWWNRRKVLICLRAERLYRGISTHSKPVCSVVNVNNVLVPLHQNGPGGDLFWSVP